MAKKLAKKEAEGLVEDFFSRLVDKTPREVMKMKKLAMQYRISLGNRRKLFCRYCFTPFRGVERVRIKQGKKVVQCAHCSKISRWKL